jgi:hypothetical protein
MNFFELIDLIIYKMNSETEYATDQNHCIRSRQNTPVYMLQHIRLPRIRQTNIVEDQQHSYRQRPVSMIDKYLENYKTR